MKTAAVLSFLLPVAAAFAGPADDVLPKPYPASRYQSLAQHSPFSPPTGPAPVAPPPVAPKAPGWADTLSIAAAMQDGNNYLVTIVDSAANERFLASTDPAVKNSHDVSVTSVQWSDLPNETQAMLRRGTEFAAVRFDAPNSPRPAAGNSPGAPAIPGSGGVSRLNAPPANRMFNPPPAAPAANPAAGGPLRRNQIIRATPPGMPNSPPVPQSNLIRPVQPRPPGTTADDDDDE